MKLSKEKRTLTQNSALHLWLEQISEILIAEGHTMTEVIEQLGKGVEVWPTKEALKECVVRPLINKTFSEISTTQIEKMQEMNQLIDMVVKFFAGMGIELPPFPSVDTEEEQMGERVKNDLQ